MQINLHMDTYDLKLGTIRSFAATYIKQCIFIATLYDRDDQG